jgi:hypothetical protein
MAAGYDKVANFRESVFRTPDLNETLKLAREFFFHLGEQKKRITDHDTFMTSGHG